MGPDIFEAIRFLKINRCYWFFACAQKALVESKKDTDVSLTRITFSIIAVPIDT